MNRGPLLFLGLFVSVALSFWSLVFTPQMSIGRQQEANAVPTGDRYPLPRPGLAQKGADVYRAAGCAECHTRQVLPEALGADIARGWGTRRSVAQDYLYDHPVMLGRVRLGPDLSNIGVRQTNAVWHLTHLYNPRLLVPGSTMPLYRYMFEVRELAEGEARSANALPLDDPAEAKHEVVPGPDALALTAYLLSLKSDLALTEAPVPKPATNQPPAEATNTVEAGAAPAPAQ